LIKLRDRVTYLNEECDKIRIKMAESKSHMKDFEVMMRKKSVYPMQMSEFTEKDRFGAYHVCLSNKLILNFKKI
jgi:hypothetical protein